MSKSAEALDSSSSSRASDVLLLVVEDDPALLRFLTTSLDTHGYRVAAASTGRAALDLATAATPDVTVLDLGLPDTDGLEVCRHLRRITPNPILVLTADGTEERLVRALDEGADDYLTKPFSMPELLARLRVAVRHRHVLAAVVDEPLLRIGSLVVDLAAHEAAVDGRALHLRRREFQVLETLARNAGKLVTRRSLALHIWGAEQAEGAQANLNTLIALLRKQLGEGPGRPTIETQPGVGYRLIGPPGRSSRRR